MFIKISQVIKVNTIWLNKICFFFQTTSSQHPKCPFSVTNSPSCSCSSSSLTPSPALSLAPGWRVLTMGRKVPQSQIAQYYKYLPIQVHYYFDRHFGLQHSPYTPPVFGHSLRHGHHVADSYQGFTSGSHFQDSFLHHSPGRFRCVWMSNASEVPNSISCPIASKRVIFGALISQHTSFSSFII